MPVHVEILAAAIRLFPPGSSYGEGPWNFALVFQSLDPDTAILKLGTGDTGPDGFARQFIAARAEVKLALRSLGFKRARWARLKGGKLIWLTFSCEGKNAG